MTRCFRGPVTSRSDAEMRTLQSAPKEGTKLREVYDLFMASPGTPIDWPTSRSQKGMKETLIDFYGLDIRFVGPRGGNKGGKYVLAGMYRGSEFVSFLEGAAQEP